MAVDFKAPVKTFVLVMRSLSHIDVISKISAFSDFSEDIVISTMEEWWKIC